MIFLIILLRRWRDSLLILDDKLTMYFQLTDLFIKCLTTTSEKTVGKFIYELEDNNWDIPELRKLLEEIIPAAYTFLRIL